MLILRCCLHTSSFENADIAQALPGLLMICLNSIIFHIEFIRDHVTKNLSHDFNKLPTLQMPALVKQLRHFVTTEWSDRIPEPTGIPPHVNHAIILRDLLSKTHTMLNHILLMADELKQAVHDAIEKNDQESGNSTMGVLRVKLQKMKIELIAAVTSCAGCCHNTQEQDSRLTREPQQWSNVNDKMG